MESQLTSLEVDIAIQVRILSVGHINSHRVLREAWIHLFYNVCSFTYICVYVCVCGYIWFFKHTYKLIIYVCVCVLLFTFCPVHWGCRTQWLLPCRVVRLLHNECPEYDTKPSDGEVPVMLQFWGIRNIPLLSSLSGPLWPGVITPDRFLSVSQIELNCVMMNWIF